MDPLAVAQRYFDAWNARDPEAIAATFAPGGTYSDPNVPDGLDPQATGSYAAGLFASFPDLRFDLTSKELTAAGTVAAQWTMVGTNTEPFRGLPPTGRAVSVPGADFISVEGEGVKRVEGYFDAGTMVRQLGLDVIVQPSSIGPFSFGTSTYVSRKDTEPGAISMTVLEARSDEEREQVRMLYSANRHGDARHARLHRLDRRRHRAADVHVHGVGNPRSHGAAARRAARTRRRWGSSSAPSWQPAGRPASGRRTT